MPSKRANKSLPGPRSRSPHAIDSKSTSKQLSFSSKKRVSQGKQYRAELASETLQILERGSYEYKSLSGESIHVELKDLIDNCIHGTTLYPQNLKIVTSREATHSTPNTATRNIYVSPYNTLETARNIVQRLQDEKKNEEVLLLNFASAKNPGGGFIRGSLAQEECLALCSGLYASLTSKTASPYYEMNKSKQTGNNFYSSCLIYSPSVPIFRGSHAPTTIQSQGMDLGSGFLDSDAETSIHLSQPWRAAIITCPAVNMNIALKDMRNERQARSKATQEMKSRIFRVLEVAQHHGHVHLVLGAWGCGVFKQNPQEIAGLFNVVLALPRFANYFETIAFAILPGPNLTHFQNVFGGTSAKTTRDSI